MWRSIVMLRDQGCVARRLDPEGCGPCYGKWGDPLPIPTGWDDLEADYIYEARFRDAEGTERYFYGPRHFLARDHVALCPGHHRGTGPQQGRIWAKEAGRRDALRAYLEERCQGQD